MGFLDYVNSLLGKRVFVIGAGVSNTPLIEALLNAGVDVTVCDRRVRNELGSVAVMFEQKGAKLRLGDDYLSNIDADIIFRTPGLMPWNPELQEAVARGAALTSEMEVFLEVCPCKIIGVTGSDGKTTTTSLVGDILRNEGIKAYVGGNIGSPLLCKADAFGQDDIAVLELSSFQLISMTRSPHIAVVTNVSPNHLDIHSGMDEYVKAKSNILTHQADSDRVVLNLDNAYTRAYAGLAVGEKSFFSRSGKVSNGVFLKDGLIYESRLGSIAPLIQTDELFLPGIHNIENYMAAFAAVQGLVSVDAMKRTAREFRGVSHRIEYITQIHEVTYYNDSSASSPSRTIAALKSFDQKVILIAGGKSKGIEFDGLGKAIGKHVKMLYLTGMTAKHIRDAVVNAPGYNGEPGIFICDSLNHAAASASEAAVPGDVVLFSPASTSFDSFKNFEHRGEVFKDIIRKMDMHGK